MENLKLGTKKIVNSFHRYSANVPKITTIIIRYSCIRIQSDAIVVVSGIPSIVENHVQSALSFAIDVESLISSFCNATCAELGFRCGIECGSVTAGLIGQFKWHYDVIGATVEEAIKIESSVSDCGVYDVCCCRKAKKLVILSEKCGAQNVERSFMNPYTLRFRNTDIENAFNSQFNQWFVPALAVSILFLVVYGIYHILVLPRHIATLALIIVALIVMFTILTMLYINYFQHFCHFITRTAVGHSVAVLFVISLLFVSGVVNTFSCPQNNTTNPLSECYVVHYSVLNCALWMLTLVVFVRFPSLALLGSLIFALMLYCLHALITHSSLYLNYSND
ncbi:unnamed protein product [Enterobius vermicularis]|uniref:adenylate cyclase n=1 Tax=Enterobius vermicularis TaxID=51028 RepID=A0A0N4VJF9_ENTVE|nr:unnamed protein product [Enterobius vermicularis]